jgi:hypothetical protein
MAAKGDIMGSRRTAGLLRDRVFGIAASLALVSGVVAGCGPSGPSEDEIRADIDEVCAGLVRDLSKLDAEPEFTVVALRADQAGYEYGMAGYRVGEISKEGAAKELASALDALEDASRDLEEHVTWRDYASLAGTREGGESALADALAAAESLGATECSGIGVRIGYFALAADGAEAAAAAIAPTGDYVADVNAACARYAEDTDIIFWNMGMRAAVSEYVDLPSTARDYLDMVEDLAVISRALGLLIDDLAGFEPPAGAEAHHDDLVEGYRSAREGFRSLRDDDEGDLLEAAAEQVEEAAGLLGVDCGVFTSLV